MLPGALQVRRAEQDLSWIERVVFCDSVEETLAGVDFVQEVGCLLMLAINAHSVLSRAPWKTSI